MSLTASVEATAAAAAGAAPALTMRQAELAEKSVHLKAGLATILVGCVLIIVALLLLAQALVLLLIGFGLSPLAATLIVAVAFACGGIALVAGGRRELDAGTLTPHRTLDDLERDRALVKEKLS